MPSVMDPEARAADTIARALGALPNDASRRRVVDWMKDRFSLEPLMRYADLEMWKMATGLLDCAREFVTRCPVCGGTGELAADDNGFKPRCGVCSAFRDALAANASTESP